MFEKNLLYIYSESSTVLNTKVAQRKKKEQPQLLTRLYYRGGRGWKIIVIKHLNCCIGEAYVLSAMRTFCLRGLPGAGNVWCGSWRDGGEGARWGEVGGKRFPLYRGQHEGKPRTFKVGGALRGMWWVSTLCIAQLRHLPAGPFGAKGHFVSVASASFCRRCELAG